MERKLVYIEWDDIIQSDSNWREVDDALDWAGNEASIARQTGFLLDKDENYITLVCSYMPPELAGTIVRIPVATIKYMKEYSIDQVKSL